MPEYTDALQQYMTHQPERPNPAQPYLDAAKNFYAGGLHGVLKGAGVKTPEWSDRLAGFLNNPSANAALGVMSPMKVPSLGGRTVQVKMGKPVEVEAYKGSHPYVNEPDRDWKGNIIKDYGPRRQLMVEEPFKSSAGHAGFFSSDPEVASRFAQVLSREGTVFPVKIKFNNPYVIDGKGKPAASWQFESVAREHGMQDALKQYQDALKDPKYDGIIVKNTKDEGHVYIPKEHTQLKPGLFPDE